MTIYELCYYDDDKPLRISDSIEKLETFLAEFMDNHNKKQTCQLHKFSREEFHINDISQLFIG